MIFACFYPYRQITFLLFFVFPISLKPKFIVLGLLAFDLLPPAKRALSRVSLGFGARAPRLTRGLMP